MLPLFECFGRQQSVTILLDYSWETAKKIVLFIKLLNYGEICSLYI